LHPFDDSAGPGTYDLRMRLTMRDGLGSFKHIAK
jgi:hypothetical protein